MKLFEISEFLKHWSLPLYVGRTTTVEREVCSVPLLCMCARSFTFVDRGRLDGSRSIITYHNTREYEYIIHMKYEIWNMEYEICLLDEGALTGVARSI